jgi:ketosteroid isomerase-like protein
MSHRLATRRIAYAMLLNLAVLVQSAAGEPESRATPTAAERAARRELVAAVFQWIEATNSRDFDAQQAYYPETMQAFYLWRNVSRSAVLAEKRRVFDDANTIDIKADAPQIIIDSGGESGRTYFRKTYAIESPRRKNTGVVLQELRWEKQRDGWKIVSERDLRVIRPARR